jgi:sugar lactone lactonase YvrE
MSVVFAPITGSAQSFTMYVANYVDGSVSTVTPAGVVSAFASGFDGPDSLAVDGSGNLYVANSGNGTVSEVTPAGIVSTFASGFVNPGGLAFDGGGNLYVASHYGGDGTVSEVTPAGIVSTFANGFSDPGGLAFDGSGNLYVANVGNGTVSEVTPAGIVSTFANVANAFDGPYALAFDGSGNLYVVSYDVGAYGGLGSTVFEITRVGVVSNFAEIGDIVLAVACDGSGNVYVASYDFGTVSEVTPAGVVSTFANGLSTVEAIAIVSAPTPPTITTQPQNQGFINGQTVFANFNVGACGRSIAYQWQSSTDGGVTWTLLSNNSNYSGVTSTTLTVTGTASALAGYEYECVATNALGSATSNPAMLISAPFLIYVGNAFNETVATITPAGVVSTFASGFDSPDGLAFDGTGNLYVANSGDGTVSEVTPAGVATTFASGFSDPQGLAFDGSGNLYVANGGNGDISEITPSGVVSTFAGGFNTPGGLAFDGGGNLYVANSGDGTVSEVTPAGVVSGFSIVLSDLSAIAIVSAPSAPTITLQPQNETAPPGGAASMSVDASGRASLTTFQWRVSTDGGATWTRLSNNATYSGVTSGTLAVSNATPAMSGYEYECVVSNPFGSATSNPATLTPLAFLMYVAGGSTIVQITPSGLLSTFASGLNTPAALAFDGSGNLYVADDGGTISKITPAGVVSTFAGGFDEADALAFDGSGNLYVANGGNTTLIGGTISKVTPAGAVSTFASGFRDLRALACDGSGSLYVSGGDSDITRITPAGVVSLFASNLLDPAALAFDGSGNLYAADPQNGGPIYEVTQAGMGSTIGYGGPGTFALGFDGSGNVYVASYAYGLGTISEFTPTGIGSVFAYLEGGFGAMAIVSAPIPPTTSNYTVTVSASPATGGTVSGGTTFVSGSPSFQSVVASASYGYVFANWTVNGSVVSSYVKYYFTLGGNLNLVANFDQISYQTLDEPNSVNGTCLEGISGANIVGYYLDGNDIARGFLYNGATFTPLDDPNAVNGTYPTGIEGSTIVGYYEDSDSQSHGFLCNGTNYSTVDNPNGYNTELEGISGGIIVGGYGSAVGWNNFLYSSGNFTPFVPNGASESLTGSDGGSIVVDGSLYDGTTQLGLNDPESADAIYARGLSGGMVVGSYLYDGGFSSQAFLYSGDVYYDLDDPAADILDDPSAVPDTFANGISGNKIVGYYFDSNGISHGFIATLTPVTANPSIASLSLSGTNLVLNGINGQSGSTYYVLTSTNLIVPLSQWTPVATNVLSASGNFSITVTNTVTGNVPQRFYILQEQ